MEFNIPKEQSSIIKVIGVGGGGGNAVNHMYNLGIKGVDFIVCNTDHQALDQSPVPIKIQLGQTLTEGRGAGSIPEIGKNAAIEDIEDIRDFLAENTKMVFVTAGMGGGTGTGAAPVIAKVARDMGILTVGIVTMPFSFEGKKRKEQAAKGLEEMRQSVDTLLVINNDRLREMYGNLTLKNAFAHADDVLTTAAKGIAEVISVTGTINVDFNDVNTVMMNSGVAIMGQATAEGENRAIQAAQNALASPLLNDNDISGAKYVLLNITYGSQEVLMDEISDITDFIQEEAGSTADVIWGHGVDASLDAELGVTIIATGFNSSPDTGVLREEPQRKYDLENDKPSPIVDKVSSPVQEMNVPPTPIDEDEAPEPYIKTGPEPVQEQPSIEFEVKSPFDEPTTEEPAEQWTAPTENTLDEEGVKKYSLDDDYQPEEPSNLAETPAPAAEPAPEPQPQIQPEAPAQELSEEPPVDEADQQRLSQERINRIKELSTKLKTPSGLTDLENEPAYKRRNVDLDDVPHSSESNVSRFTLSEEEGEDGEKRTGLKDNNSFLHDNVD